ncbi:MAG: Tic22 family protein [Microcoleaceae cyanobacterium]
MHQSLIRLSSILGIAGVSLLAGPSFLSFPTPHSLFQPPAAIALAPETLAEKLDSVLLFTIAAESRRPLVRQVTLEGQSGPVNIVSVFVSRNDAQASLEQIKANQPDIGSSLQVTPVTLGEIYELNQKDSSEEQNLRFLYIPTKQQIDAARAVLQAQGETDREFSGVPLFLAKGSDNNYLMVQDENRRAIPVFFLREDLQQMIDFYKAQQSDLQSVQIEVIPLEGLLQALQDESSEFFELMEFVLPRETLEFIRQGQTSRQSGN